VPANNVDVPVLHVADRAVDAPRANLSRGTLRQLSGESFQEGAAVRGIDRHRGVHHRGHFLVG
jgi:hypothetical protein